ncbi:hypothetical protein ON010_g6525 [Phytophthora cinnamomi]|nr:hypothetical protein ON010_g6525 [Phytophthora cinnamomi]
MAVLLPTTMHRDVGVMLTTDDHVQKLNRRFRKKDKPTDILSFPFHKLSIWTVSSAGARAWTIPAGQDERGALSRGHLHQSGVCTASVRRPAARRNHDAGGATAGADGTRALPLDGVRVAALASDCCTYDHELDDDYERMQKAENYILNRYAQFLPPAFAPVDSSMIAATDAETAEKQQSQELRHSSMGRTKSWVKLVDGSLIPALDHVVHHARRRLHDHRRETGVHESRHEARGAEGQHLVDAAGTHALGVVALVHEVLGLHGEEEARGPVGHALNREHARALHERGHALLVDDLDADAHGARHGLERGHLLAEDRVGHHARLEQQRGAEHEALEAAAHDQFCAEVPTIRSEESTTAMTNFMTSNLGRVVKGFGRSGGGVETTGTSRHTCMRTGSRRRAGSSGRTSCRRRTGNRRLRRLLIVVGGLVTAGGAVVDGGAVVNGGPVVDGREVVAGGIVVDGGSIVTGGLVVAGGEVVTGGLVVDGGAAVAGGAVVTGGIVVIGACFNVRGRSTRRPRARRAWGLAVFPQSDLEDRHELVEERPRACSGGAACVAPVTCAGRHHSLTFAHILMDENKPLVSVLGDPGPAARSSRPSLLIGGISGGLAIKVVIEIVLVAGACSALTAQTTNAVASITRQFASAEGAAPKQDDGIAPFDMHLVWFTKIHLGMGLPD